MICLRSRFFSIKSLIIYIFCIASVLVFFLYPLISIAKSPVSGIQALEDFLSKIHSGQGKFRQIYRRNKQMLDESTDRLSDISTGYFKFLRPNRFIWVYETPYAQHLQSDGESFFLYDQHLKQVIKRKSKLSLAENPVEILFGSMKSLLDVKKKYRVKNIFPEKNNFLNRDLVWVKLETKKESSEFLFIYIGFGLKHERVKLSELRLDSITGDSIEIDFFAIKQNVPFNRSVFEFIVPSDVDLIED